MEYRQNLNFLAATPGYFRVSRWDGQRITKGTNTDGSGLVD